MCHVVHTQPAALALSWCQPRALQAVWAQAGSRSARGTIQHILNRRGHDSQLQDTWMLCIKKHAKLPNLQSHHHSCPLLLPRSFPLPLRLAEGSMWRELCGYSHTKTHRPLQKQRQQLFLNVVKPTSNGWPNQESNHHGKWPELFVTLMLKPCKFFKISQATRNELTVGSCRTESTQWK